MTQTLVFAMLVTLVSVGLFVDLAASAAQIDVAGFSLFSTAFVFFVLNLTAVGYSQGMERTRPATLFALLWAQSSNANFLLLIEILLGSNGIGLPLVLSEAITTVCIIVFYLYQRKRSMIKK